MRDIDLKIAEKKLRGMSLLPDSLPRWSEDIDLAMELLDTVPTSQTIRLVRRRQLQDAACIWICEIDKPGVVEDQIHEEASTPELAICQAYLRMP